MGKYLFWGVVTLGVLIGTRLLARKAAGQGTKPSPFRFKPGQDDQKAESMVRCAHCGVHLPRSEASLIGGNTWCSQDHAKLGVKRQG